MAQLVRHCATIRFPMVSLEFFIDVILPARLWTWGTQPLTEMNIRNISWGKGGWCVNLTSQPSCVHHLEICTCNMPVEEMLDMYVKYWTEIS